jgi:hypothetical protein
MAEKSEKIVLKEQASKKLWQDIGAEQGWNEHSKLSVLLDFIEERGLFSELALHAQNTADIENGI